MTPQEEQMIRGLIDRVQGTQLSGKDVAAQQLLDEGLSRNPDAVYVLAQTVLVQQYALDQAQTQLKQAKDRMEQMEQMRQQAGAQQQASPQSSRPGSFLGNLLHLNQAPAGIPPQQQQGYGQQYPPPPPPPPGYGQGGYGQPAYGQPGYGGPGMMPPQGGGFLQNAMQTAAGVAAGALAFEGIESLMHGFGHAAGYGGGSGLGGFGGGDGRPEVVNNYYDDRGGEHGASAAEREEGDRENRFADQGGGDSGRGHDFADTSTTESSDDDSGSNDGADDYGTDSGTDGDFSSDSGDYGGGDDSNS